jgi:hypothetical protein
MTFMTHMTRDPGAAAWQTPDSVAVTLPLGHPAGSHHYAQRVELISSKLP